MVTYKVGRAAAGHRELLRRFWEIRNLGYVVITSIQAATPAVLRMAEAAGRSGLSIIIVGDKKTPQIGWPEHIEFVDVNAQLCMASRLSPLLPFNHYARKNLGYLSAMSRQAPVIFDTDDDNAPLSQWSLRSLCTTARRCMGGGWINAYHWFTGSHIWPRGLPLDFAHSSHVPAVLGPEATVIAPIQQGLANGSPDVDAVWRLVLDKSIEFTDGPSVMLPPGAWCPFNSQSTWWFPQAYPLMYLPSFVSFRMTDIWRSFVAQRCLWALDLGVAFHGPEMFQDRNEHNLMRDFEQEVPGYLYNERIRRTLEALTLQLGEENIGANLHRCYEALVSIDIVPANEMPLVEAWLADIDSIRCDGGRLQG